jgi:hypothetical protein
MTGAEEASAERGKGAPSNAILKTKAGEEGDCQPVCRLIKKRQQICKVNYGLRNYPVENVEAPYTADHEGTTAWIMQDLAEVHDDVRSRCDGKVCVTCVLDEWLPNSCFFSLH